MENNSKNNEQISKTKTTPNYTPETHFIIDKNLFHCIICYDISPNVYETGCCGLLVCYNCKSYLNNPNCPVCKIKTDFKISKVAKRIISNSITECPLCSFTDNYDRIASHFFTAHREYILTCDKLEKDNKFFNFLSVYFCISLEKKFFMHDHPLHLVTKEKDCVCYAGSILRFKNCKMLDSFSEEAQNKKVSNVNNEQSQSSSEVNLLEEILPSFTSESPINNNQDSNSSVIVSSKASEDSTFNVCSSSNKKLSESEELKNMIIKRMTYFCSECEGYFCESCLEGNDIWIPVKVHEHPLNLVNRNKGWYCDGRKCPDGCFNVNDSTVGLARYRCTDCDFDLCEKCLMYYMH